MIVQSINQSIYSVRKGQGESVNFSSKSRPGFKSNEQMHNMSMPSFKGKPNVTLSKLIDSSFVKANKSAKSSAEVFEKAFKVAENTKTLKEEIASLATSVYKSIKNSYNKSSIKKYMVAPVQKKWSDFASKAPRFSQVVKGAFIVAAGITAFDAITDRFTK